MSTQRGNVKKGAQKYKNKNAFKNDLHDRTPQMELIKKVQVTGACQRCTDVIEWKIKYRKFKPLTTAKKCTKCLEKTVKKSYFIICVPCMKKLQVCGKCGQKKEVTEVPGLSEAEQMSQQSQLEAELEHLTERQRRQFFRLQASGKSTSEALKKLREGNGDDGFCVSDEGSDGEDDDDDADEDEDADLLDGTKTVEKSCDKDIVDISDMNKLKIETQTSTDCGKLKDK
ncbi:uncharacterized protein C9orf85 homolog [Mizuhopecten yessoensis]|uniref:Uncharacterized protein n=1 Tax=Mizuhopecten yessoensis TaxID=6573 RepID=A0A210QG09_MIZYE|nr:uncharacterized protein C9orf85 homolog [Mizuhopecten yessoensis]OWF47551.1 hypothetical protein KP79_PYT15613 [Mizuhopecten yessoensis]